MPGVQPHSKDLYLCRSLKLNLDRDNYIVKFTPHASMHTAHHILLYGCLAPGNDEEVWNCGEMTGHDDDEYKVGPVCASGSQIIYAWAHDAPELKLPEGVGFKVGGETPIMYLVVQAHYMHPLDAPDYSGLTLHYTPEPMPKLASVLLMVTGGRIKAKSTENFETACLIDENVEMHPFAFRTHTHTHGKVVSGYVIQDGKWTLLGKKSPQLPQMFYPIADSGLTIKQGDIVAARCTMVNDEDRDIYIGSTGNDEMCNFYMMYWSDQSKPSLSDNTCFSNGPPDYHWDTTGGLTDIPADASDL